MNARIITTISSSALVGLFLFLAASERKASAGEALRIETLEEKSWSAAVAALQHDRASEGHIIHVIVRDNDGTRLQCGTYAIGLDTVSAEAFQSEGCERATDSTALRLIHRSALFDHGDAVSHPRAPRIVASRTQTGEASGGAKAGAESAVDCTVAVHPFIRDLENGNRIALSPGRYVLKTKNDDIKVKPTDDGWTFLAPRGTTSTVEYFVTDSHKGDIVLNDRVSMNCSVQTATTSATSVPYVPASSSSTTAPTIGPMPMSTSSATSEPFVVKPYEPPGSGGDGDNTSNNGNQTSTPWLGHAFTVNLGIGSAFMRTSGLRFSNNTSSTDAQGLGLHDSAGPLLTGAVAYERPGIYGSLGVGAGFTSMSHRTLWSFGVTSVIAAAVHLSDVTLYLGPNVQANTYQVSSDISESLAYGSRAQLSLGAAAGARYHIRDDRTGKLAYVLGAELIAPVAGGPSPWMLTAQIAFGSGK